MIGMAKQDNRHHCYLSIVVSVRTGVRGAAIFENPQKNRVQWCRNRLDWTIQEQWNTIIFLVKCCVI
jgi:hypothetical protein